jgi:hypothetical protein
MVVSDDGDFGAEAVEHFENARKAIEGLYAPELFGSIGITNGFVKSLMEAGYPNRFHWNDVDVWEADLRSIEIGGLDSSMSDDVDLFFIATHGRNVEGIIELLCGSVYGEIHTTPEEGIKWIARSTDWKLGNRDLEWLAIYSCHTVELEDFIAQGFSRYQNIFYGLHLILGSHKDMIFGQSYIGLGKNFADNLLDGDTVASAWLSGINEKNDNHPAVLSAERESTWNRSSIDWSSTTMQRDRYWGRGEVTSDIKRESLYWIGVRWVE